MLLHRDIRWPNVIRSQANPAKWILIDWEDASTVPTMAAMHMNEYEHSPRVFLDGHSVEVDIWGVGQLITRSTQKLTAAMKDLGQRMMEGKILTAVQGLCELTVLPEF
jgi:hypothetical protein